MIIPKHPSFYTVHSSSCYNFVLYTIVELSNFLKSLLTFGAMANTIIIMTTVAMVKRRRRRRSKSRAISNHSSLAGLSTLSFLSLLARLVVRGLKKTLNTDDLSPGSVGARGFFWHNQTSGKSEFKSTFLLVDIFSSSRSLFPGFNAFMREVRKVMKFASAMGAFFLQQRPSLQVTFATISKAIFRNHFGGSFEPSLNVRIRRSAVKSKARVDRITTNMT